MREDVPQALAIDESSTIEERTIDITTISRRSGPTRRIEIAFYRLEDHIYLSGIPGPRRRDWLVNLAAHPEFTFHLKNGVVADLSATATVIDDPTERRRVLSVFVEEINRRHGPDSPWPEAGPRRVAGVQPSGEGHLPGLAADQASRRLVSRVASSSNK